MAENTIGIPSFNMTLSRTLAHFLRIRPAGSGSDGDVGICNDPWLTSGHLPDITVVAPVFIERRLVGWTGSVAHQADLGGIGLGRRRARGVRGRACASRRCCSCRPAWWCREVEQFIRANSRLPDQVLGDIAAQVAAGDAAARGLRDLLRREGIDDLAPDLACGMRAAPSALMRRAISEIPDGDYAGGHRPRRHRRGGQSIIELDDQQARRRVVPGLCRHLAGGWARAECGNELHRGLFLLSAEMRAGSGHAAQ